MHGTPPVIVHLMPPSASANRIICIGDAGNIRRDRLLKRRLQTNISPFLHDLLKLLDRCLDFRILYRPVIQMESPFIRYVGTSPAI